MEVRAVRATNFNFDDKNLKVSGYVNETGKMSDPIPNWGETDQIADDDEFQEIMEPGVFEDAIRNSDFVDFYFEHEPKKYLASTREGSLNLSEDDTGLKMSANIVPTSWGKDAYTLIKSGAVKSMSFGFIPINDHWDMSGDMPVRHITKIQLLEVSAVRFPAYPDSSIEARRKHFKRLNALLEKRGLTLKNIHKSRSSEVKDMTKKTDKKETRSGSNSNQPMTSADAQAIVSGLKTLSTSIDNHTNAVQENSEVYKSVAAQIMQSANGDRAKKVAPKDTKKRDGEIKPVAEKPKVTKAKEVKPKVNKPKGDAPKDEKPSDEPKVKDKPKETPKDDERAKKAKADKAKAAKRAADAKALMSKFKELNETI